MSIDVSVSSIAGFRLKMKQFQTVIPEVKETQPRWDPKTGKATKPVEVVVKPKQFFWQVPGGEKFDEPCEFCEELNKALSVRGIRVEAEYNYDGKVEYMYVGPRFPSPKKYEEYGGMLTVYHPDQEINLLTFPQQIEDIKTFLKEEYGIEISESAKLYTVVSVS